MRPANTRIELLASLHGPSTQHRLENIVDVASGTYKWVFDRTQVSFSDWLEGGGGATDTPFWIRGKPGSGKSTLMKYILSEQRTLELLQGGSDAPWILVGFFFSDWAIRMTLEDVVQHILYQIIAQSPHLGAVIDRFYQVAVEKQGTSLPKWDYPAMYNALKAVLRQRESSCQIALFLDALDEVSGDYIDQLMEMIDQLGALPDGQIVKLKVCIASRPWLAVHQILEDYSGFVLQDHTIADISIYINEMLSSMTVSKGFSGLQKQAFVDKIITKANGVFSWITLVARSLQMGYVNGDSLPELERRLDEVPSDLENLYLQMVRSIEPIYAPQAYKMLQVALCALRPLSLEAFSSCIFDVPDTPKDPERFKTQQQAWTKRITARCVGMLEVTPSLFLDEGFDYKVERYSYVLQEGGSHLPAIAAARPAQRRSILAVHFIHQTFREFLSQNQYELFGSVSPSDRQSGNLLLLQAGVKSEQPWARELARDIFTFTHRIEKDNPREAEDAAKALDSLSHIGRPLQHDHRLKWCLPQAQLPGWLELLALLDGRDDLQLLSLAVGANLTSYVRTRLPSHPAEGKTLGVQDKMLEIMLPLAIFGPKILSENTNRTEMVKMLLDYGIPVNGYPLRSLFECFIPSRAKFNERSADLPTTSTLALLLGDAENQWDMEESDRSALIMLLIKNGAPVDDMVYRLRKGLREFQKGLPALHHCVVHESPELVRVVSSLPKLRVDWPVSLGMYAVMRQDPLMEFVLGSTVSLERYAERRQDRTVALAKAGFGKRSVGTESAVAISKEVLIAASLMFTAHHPGWAVPNPKESVLAKILARLKP